MEAWQHQWKEDLEEKSNYFGSKYIGKLSSKMQNAK
jgi:hypothetical protein